MVTQPLLRTALIAGLAASAVLLVFQPGLATAAAVMAFLGWSRENAMRVAAIAMARLCEGGREPEHDGGTLERLEAIEGILRRATVLKVERGNGAVVAVTTLVDNLGEPPTATEH